MCLRRGSAGHAAAGGERRFEHRGRCITCDLEIDFIRSQTADQPDLRPRCENSIPSDLIPRGRLLSFASAPTGLVATGQKLFASHCQAAGSGGYCSLTTWLVEVEIQLCTVLCGCWTYVVLVFDMSGLGEPGA